MRPDSHEIYGRRRSRNVGVGIALGAFALLSFAVTVVKLTEAQSMQSFDPALTSDLIPAAGN